MPYKPELEALRSLSVPDWFHDAKLGIGEAIFNTCPWLEAIGQPAHGRTARFTQNSNALYAIVLERDSIASAIRIIPQPAVPS